MLQLDPALSSTRCAPLKRNEFSRMGSVRVASTMAMRPFLMRQYGKVSHMRCSRALDITGSGESSTIAQVYLFILFLWSLCDEWRILSFTVHFCQAPYTPSTFYFRSYQKLIYKPISPSSPPVLASPSSCLQMCCHQSAPS